MICRFTLPTLTTFSSRSPVTPLHRKAVYDDQSFLCSARFGHHAAARCPALAAPPLDDAEWPTDADRHAGAVRLRARRDVGRWPWRRGTWRCLHQLRRARDYPHDCGQRVCDDCDQPLHGHERRYHHPLPHHGDLPRLGVDWTGSRKLDPDDDHHRPRHRGSAAHGLPALCGSRRLDRGARRHRAVHPRSHVDGGGVRPGGQNATPIHVRARVNSAMTPSAAIQATGPAEGRKPMSSATPMTRTMVIIVRIKLPRTCPVNTEAREIAMVRKRGIIPSLMALQRLIAVVAPPLPTVMRIIAGAT